MALEVESTPFYDTILKSNNYIDNYLPIKVCLYRYISRTLFGKLKDRVIYANQSYTFRKRLETLAKGFDLEKDLGRENFNITTLNLPFASFYETGDIEIIKQTSATEYEGVYSVDLAKTFRFLETKRQYEATVYYDNLSDLRLATQILQWEKSLGTSALYGCKYSWRGSDIDIPCFIKVTKISSSRSSFKEEQFLTDYKIYTLTIGLEVTTLDLLLNRGYSSVLLPSKHPIHGDTWESEKDNIIYYTQKTILQFSSYYYDAIVDKENARLKSNIDIEYETRPATEKEIDEVEGITGVLNNATYDVVKGFFEAGDTVYLNRLAYNTEETTVNNETGEVIAKIDFLIKPSSYKFFRKMELLLPSHKPIIIEDCKTTGIKIDGLHPNSTYRLFLRTYSLNGAVDQSELEFTTPEWINESLRPSSNVGEQTDGVTEETQLDIPKEPPKRVQINGLYGLNF